MRRNQCLRHGWTKAGAVSQNGLDLLALLPNRGNPALAAALGLALPLEHVQQQNAQAAG